MFDKVGVTFARGDTLHEDSFARRVTFAQGKTFARRLFCRRKQFCSVIILHVETFAQGYIFTEKFCTAKILNNQTILNKASLLHAFNFYFLKQKLKQ